MALFPVIMCGGAGTRLWPASRPSRPKQFLSLVGARSPFQETVARVVPLVRGEGRLVVVGGLAHRDWIIDQLAELGVEAQILLEPEGRDSAPAMTAAAVWVSQQDPEGVVAFIASDHHIPDHLAFQTALLEAARATEAGRIVTLGVRPTEPSSAYGYIRPTGPGLSDVAAFVEKPDTEKAGAYIREGYLWNSGNFIVTARSLLDELQSFAPEITLAVRASVDGKNPASVQVLTDDFRRSPRISIDYAVMEKTSRAAVLPVDFSWSDLGAWDAVATASEDGQGPHILTKAENCLIRAPEGTLIAVVGVSDLAVIAEADAILVCAMDRAQEVRTVVEEIRSRSPRHLDFPHLEPDGLQKGGTALADWLRLRALPIWSSLGQANSGLFLEALTLDGRVTNRPHRARVQARQIFVYCEAGRLGWPGPWRQIVSTGLARLLNSHIRDDGLSRSLVADNGESLDDTARLYDQAFVLLALATVRGTGVDGATAEIVATRLRDTLQAQTPPVGGFIEAGEHPYQANANMHLLEACLAWEAAGGDRGWSTLADRLVTLALDHFIDPDGGFLREFFQADWTPAEGADGTLVEPGHQFEWAWLLTRYGRSRDDARAMAAATRLYASGRRGIADRPEIAVDALNTDGSVRSGQARLWPQTEWLKAALIMAETASADDRTALLADAAAALRALWLYLTPDGMWHDKHLPGGGFVAEPAPASSFYHIMAGFQQLATAWPTLFDDDGGTLTLD